MNEQWFIQAWFNLLADMIFNSKGYSLVKVSKTLVPGRRLECSSCRSTFLKYHLIWKVSTPLTPFQAHSDNLASNNSIFLSVSLHQISHKTIHSKWQKLSQREQHFIFKLRAPTFFRLQNNGRKHVRYKTKVWQEKNTQILPHFFKRN